MHSKSCGLTASDIEMCEEFKNYLQDWEIMSFQSISQAYERWHLQISSALRELSVLYWNLEKSQQNSVYK